ncbi:balbiani ring protein 3 [Eurytemora carolleeae]|uniref:balbiani ring protein 3 n=1 Tax=Eurytemora carolleeae TaxID=1294199 RepID=UPI000C789AE0|nr:balbiani ring protein 3 [Eurytemora carolleeae]|eukprot:XP_023336543.1 balbiani ring protein 3-like [Eurytemora affinis]
MDLRSCLIRLCLTSIGSNCSPRKSKLESHNIVVYVNSTPYCSTIELEHHRGPCRCDCDETLKSCSAFSERHVYSEDSCSCLCSPILLKEKVLCENQTERSWSSESCSCSCSNPRSCSKGTEWSEDTCSCSRHERDCLLNQANLSSEGRFNLYPVYLTSIIIVLIILIITSLCFAFSNRWRTPRYSQHVLSDPRGVPPTAYTITLCSSQNLDKAM